MKKSTWIIGLVASLLILTGIIFKIMHYPGASVLLVSGCASLTLFAPFLFFEKNKFADTRYKKFMNVFTLLVIAFLPIAFMFKVQHWPGGSFLVTISTFLTLAMVPFIIIHAIKETDSVKKMNFQFEAMIFTVMVGFSLLMLKGNVSKDVLNSFSFQDESIKKEIKYHDTKANDLFSTFEGAVKASGRGQSILAKAIAVKSKSDSLVAYIRSEGEIILLAADKEKISMDSLMNLRAKVNSNVAAEHMILQGKGIVLKKKIEEYREFIAANTNSKGKEIIEQFFNTPDSLLIEGTMVSWESEKFQHLPLIAVAISLNDYISHIRMLEVETISNLQAIGSKEINSVQEHQAEKKKK